MNPLDTLLSQSVHGNPSVFSRWGLLFTLLIVPFGELDEVMLWYVVNTAITPCIADVHQEVEILFLNL